MKMTKSGGEHKENMNTINVEIPSCFVIKVRDYHEFDTIKNNLKTATKLNYKYEEVCSLKQLDFHDGWYHAVFWLGKKPKNFIKKNLTRLKT